MAYPDVVVDAADISADALAVARINVEQHGLADRITVLQSDGLKALQGPYDLILCNPPYVNAQVHAGPACRVPLSQNWPGFRRRRHGFHA